VPPRRLLCWCRFTSLVWCLLPSQGRIHEKDRAMTAPVLQIVTLHGDEPCLRLIGELDLDSAALLRAAVADCLAPRPARVVLDLRDLHFCDCAGLNGLLEGRAAADRIGVALALEGVCGQVARLFALTGADTVFAGSGHHLPPRSV
jgi:anti-anti-sigma factor